MATVTYEDLEAAFDFVSCGAPFEHEAYVSLDTGAIYWVLEDEELPEDLDTSDRYLAIPHKNDLDLGRELALRFADDNLPRRYSQVEECFRHRGAYARFKELLAAAGQLEAWYAFEAQHTERALRDWCAENDLDVK